MLKNKWLGYGDLAWTVSMAIPDSIDYMDAGLKVKQTRLDGIYDRFILGQGEYPMRVFICVKPR